MSRDGDAAGSAHARCSPGGGISIRVGRAADEDRTTSPPKSGWFPFGGLSVEESSDTEDSSPNICSKIFCD